MKTKLMKIVIIKRVLKEIQLETKQEKRNLTETEIDSLIEETTTSIFYRKEIKDFLNKNDIRKLTLKNLIDASVKITGYRE